MLAVERFISRTIIVAVICLVMMTPPLSDGFDLFGSSGAQAKDDGGSSGKGGDDSDGGRSGKGSDDSGGGGSGKGSDDSGGGGSGSSSSSGSGSSGSGGGENSGSGGTNSAADNDHSSSGRSGVATASPGSRQGRRDDGDIFVVYPDGWREEVVGGRYELRDPQGRTVSRRGATSADRARMLVHSP
jgi:hypothetical protein